MRTCVHVYDCAEVIVTAFLECISLCDIDRISRTVSSRCMEMLSVGLAMETVCTLPGSRHMSLQLVIAFVRALCHLTANRACKFLDLRTECIIRYILASCCKT
jgi:hypothetical protein